MLDAIFTPGVLHGLHYDPCDDVATLYSGPRLRIYAHLWLDSIVELHHHAWNGAYQVVAGSNVHARYRFHEERCVQRKLRLGHLECERVEQGKAGDTIAVVAGGQWIHGLAYNERPSLALSIRATETPEQIRMEYWRPGVGVEAEAPDDLTLQRLKCLRFLHGHEADALETRLRAWIGIADLRSVFHAIRFARQLGMSAAAWARRGTLCRGGERQVGAECAPRSLSQGPVIRYAI